MTDFDLFLQVPQSTCKLLHTIMNYTGIFGNFAALRVQLANTNTMS